MIVYGFVRVFPPGGLPARVMTLAQYLALRDDDLSGCLAVFVDRLEYLRYRGERVVH